MIKLSRTPLPADLQTRVEERIAHLRDYLARGEQPPAALLNSYRDPLVKAHLVVEANGKCVYCESKITHVYFGDVEHIQPKALFPTERLSIDNLVLACAQCNNAKGDFWDDVRPLLNPYVDDPKEQVLALGYLLARRPGQERAHLTIDRLKLNRQSLLERRKERIELLQPLADQYMLAPPGPIKDLLREELCRQANDDSEYALIVRTYLAAACDLRCGAAA